MSTTSVKKAGAKASPAGTDGRKRLPRIEREQRILDAAELVFSEHGFAAPMEEVAAGSGVTKALLYQYFGSKEGLYDACVERGRAQLFESMDSAARSVSGGTAQLLALVVAYFDYVEDNLGSWWLLYGEASSGAVNAMRRRNAELIAELLVESARERGSDPDPEALSVLAHTLVGAGEQVGRWWSDRPEVPKQTVVSRFLEISAGAIEATFRAARIKE